MEQPLQRQARFLRHALISSSHFRVNFVVILCTKRSSVFIIGSICSEKIGWVKEFDVLVISSLWVDLQHKRVWVLTGRRERLITQWMNELISYELISALQRLTLFAHGLDTVLHFLKLTSESRHFRNLSLSKRFGKPALIRLLLFICLICRESLREGRRVNLLIVYLRCFPDDFSLFGDSTIVWFRHSRDFEHFDSWLCLPHIIT